MTTTEASPPVLTTETDESISDDQRGVDALSTFVANMPQPHDTEAELCVLGSALLSSTALDDILTELSEDDFFHPKHATIFQTITTLNRDGIPVDAISVANALSAAGNLTRIGGAEYLHTILASPPTTAAAHHYARLVKEASNRRTVLTAGLRMVATAHRTPPTELLEEATLLLKQASYSTAPQASRITTILTPTLARLRADATDPTRRRTGIRTGHDTLDQTTGGLRPGHLTVVAGSTDTDLTGLLLSLTTHPAIHSATPTLVVSWTGDGHDLTRRLLAAEANITYHHIDRANLTREEKLRVDQTVPHLEDAPLFLMSGPTTTLSDIRAAARRLQRTDHLEILALDLAVAPDTATDTDDAITNLRTLKALALELDIAVIVTHHHETPASFHPTLVDLTIAYLPNENGDTLQLTEHPIGRRTRIPVTYLPDTLTYTTNNVSNEPPTPTVFEVALPSPQTLHA